MVIAVAYGGYAFLESRRPEPPYELPDAIELPVSPEPEIQEEQPPEDEGEQVYSVGQLLVTPDRLLYQDGGMLLSIPSIGIDDMPVLDLPNPVEDGEDAVNHKLDDGIGLFFCAQMPGTGNPNVSIAGHRDIHGKEFWYLDQLTYGDKLYLEYDGRRFEYEYVDTIIIDPNDPPEIIWQPMMTREFSAITLQTCDPIGIASHRMFVAGKLIHVHDLS